MKRICRIFIVICLPLMFSGPVHAQHSGPFVGAFIGGNTLAKAKSTDALGSFGLTFDQSLQGSAVLGWDFERGNPVGEGRVELEYTRRSNRLDRVKFAEGEFEGGGSVTADSVLLNFYGVLHDGSYWSPYAGGGVGAARVETSNATVTGQPFSSDSAVVLAYQLGAGIDFALTDFLNLDLGYRFFSCASPRLREADGHTFKMDYLSHSAVIGLRVGF